MHFHRDVLAICDCFGRHVLRARARRRLLRHAAARLHLRARRPVAVPAARRRRDGAARTARRRTTCSPAIAKYGATVCFTAPTAYRAHAGQARRARHLSSLRKCVSAGETLPHADLRSLARGDRHRDHRRHRLDRDAAHLHRSPPTTTSGPAPPASRCPGYEARVLDDGRATRCRPARSAGSRCAARPAAAISPTSASATYVAERLEPHRRRLPHGRRRLLLVPGAHRRHDHLGRLQHRRARGRDGAARASGGRRMRRRRRARRRARTDRQGVRRAAAGPCRRRGADQELQDFVKANDRAVQVSPRHRVRRRAAAHRDRQAAALRAAPDAGEAASQQAVPREGASSRTKETTCPTARPEDRMPFMRAPAAGWPRPQGYANGVVAEGGWCSSPA